MKETSKYLTERQLKRIARTSAAHTVFDGRDIKKMAHFLGMTPKKSRAGIVEMLLPIYIFRPIKGSGGKFYTKEPAKPKLDIDELDRQIAEDEAERGVEVCQKEIEDVIEKKKQRLARLLSKRKSSRKIKGAR